MPSVIAPTQDYHSESDTDSQEIIGPTQDADLPMNVDINTDFDSDETYCEEADINAYPKENQ